MELGRVMSVVERFGGPIPRKSKRKYGEGNPTTAAAIQVIFTSFLTHVGLSIDNQFTISEGSAIKIYSKNKEETEDTVFHLIMRMAANDFLESDNVPSSYKYQQGCTTPVAKVSKRDYLNAILNCCDPFLLQDILGRLHSSGRAVPLLNPFVDSGQLTFFLWGLRKCRSTMQSTEGLKMEINLCTYDTYTISVMRFGVLRFSKSKVLNKVMAVLQQTKDVRYFLSNKEDPTTSVWSEGTVEIAWNININPNYTGTSTPSFALLNLRGDGKHNERQVEFVSHVANLVIVFLAKNTKCIPYNTPCNAIIVKDDSKHDKIREDAYSYHRSDELYCEGFSSTQISEKLSKLLCEKIQKNLQRDNWKSLENHSNECALFGIKVDEEDFKAAKSMVTVARGNLPVTVDPNTPFLEPSWKEGKLAANTQSNGFDTKRKQTKDSGTPLSHFFREFLRFTSLDDTNKQIFLSFMKIHFKEQLFNELSSITKQYEDRMTDLRKCNYQSNIPSESQVFDQRAQPINNPTNLYSLEESLIQSMTSIDQLMFVLWRHVKSSHASLPKNFTKEVYLNCLVSWLTNGNSIDILNFGLLGFPAAWTEEFMTKLQSTLGDQSIVHVVSILGGPKSSKAKLLNYVFGASFDESTLLFSKGLRMQLVPCQKDGNENSGNHFLLLVDIESVHLTEIVKQEITERRKDMFTLAFAITNVLIINIDMENTEEEIETIFDIFVQGLRMSKSMVRCCVVYHKKLISNRDLVKLRTRTQSELQKSCTKLVGSTEVICDKEKNSNMNDKVSTQQQIANLFKVVCSYFLSAQKRRSDVIDNVRLLPPTMDNTKLKLKKGFVENVHSLRSFITELLKVHQHGKCNFVEIAKKIVTASKNIEEKRNSFAESFISSLKILSGDELRQYYYDNIADIANKIEMILNSSMATIRNSTHADQFFKSTKTEMEFFLKEQTGELEENLKILCGNEPFLTQTCNTLLRDLQSRRDTLNSHVSKQLQIAVEIANMNCVIKKKTVNILHHLNTTKNSERIAEDRELENLVQQCVDNETRGDSKILLSNGKAKATFRVQRELRKERYGKTIHSIVRNTSFINLYASAKSISSIDDAKAYRKRFNVVNKNDHKLLKTLKKKIMELSGDYTNFEDNVVSAISSLKSYFESMKSDADKLTMSLSVLSKFICTSHKNHVLEDLQKRDIAKWTVSNFPSYIVKLVEPLKFASFDKKSEYLLSLMESLLEKKDVSVLRETYSSDMAIKFDLIPFNLLCLQRIDLCLIRLLPVETEDSMCHILDLVADLKMHCLGKTFGADQFDYDDYFEYVFESIKQMCNVFVIERDIDRIEAVAFVHVLAWAIPFMAVKECDEERKWNVSHQVEKNVPLYIALTKFMLQNRYEEYYAKIVCNEIEKVILDNITKSVQNVVTRSLIEILKTPSWKYLFIGSMLRQFCNEDNLKELISFVDNYNLCSQKWVLVLLARSVNKEKNSFIEMQRNKFIGNKIASVKMAVRQATIECQENYHSSLDQWGKIFETKLVGFNHAILDYAGENYRNINLKNFTKFCLRMLSDIQEKLKKEIELPEEGNEEDTKTWLLSLPKQILKETSDLAAGCKEQCKFCGNVCELPLSHLSTHSIRFHIPIGIKGARNRETKRLQTFTCPVLLSTKIYSSADEEQKVVHQCRKLWESFGNNWFLPLEEETIVFWKFIFSNFNKKMSSYHECREGELPINWDEYTKKDAIKSLEENYKLSSLDGSMEFMLNSCFHVPNQIPDSKSE